MVIPKTLIGLMFPLLLALSCIAQQVEVRSVPIKHCPPDPARRCTWRIAPPVMDRTAKERGQPRPQ
jgi:hypothetical protein